MITRYERSHVATSERKIQGKLDSQKSAAVDYGKTPCGNERHEKEAVWKRNGMKTKPPPKARPGKIAGKT
ncbi:hypothetical protein M514_00919 [Trichuris suis]|uniref:Uncharacterized protein n=1 Tax=Trichuris suis TaxID=68888 RepID=A0A085MLR0_9BILA|nr:hypothetical protein M513_00919 [Trichuris suis]KFD62387.1 hypothetical protein M514_00919 [Trichuris suis]